MPSLSDTHTPPAGSVSIRPATNGDGGRIAALVSAVLAEYGLRPDPETSEADLVDIEGTYLRAGGVFEVLEDEAGDLLGTVAVCPLADGACKLRKMYLVPGARGRGLGRLMLERAIAHARRLGFHAIILETVSVMEEAIRLYTRRGFRPLARAAASPRCDRAYFLNLSRDVRLTLLPAAAPPNNLPPKGISHAQARSFGDDHDDHTLR